MDDEKSLLKASMGCAGQLLIALLGIMASVAIAAWQLENATQNTEACNNVAVGIAAKQQALDVHLDELDEWRKTPQLVVLRASRVRRDTMNCILQNNGGRDLVLFGLRFELTTPQSEMKYGAGNENLPAIETAERSNVMTIDVAMRDLIREAALNLDPAVIVKPGESVTLRFIFPTPSNRYKVSIDSNAGLAEIFQFEPTVAAN